jgi:hypothetical protein
MAGINEYGDLPSVWPPESASTHISLANGISFKRAASSGVILFSLKSFETIRSGAGLKNLQQPRVLKTLQ